MTTKDQGDMVQTVDHGSELQSPAPEQQPASPELAAALAALQEAQAELTLQNSSAGAQIGRHIVEMARHVNGGDIPGQRGGVKVGH